MTPRYTSMNFWHPVYEVLVKITDQQDYAPDGTLEALEQNGSVLRA